MTLLHLGNAALNMGGKLIYACFSLTEQSFAGFCAGSNRNRNTHLYCMCAFTDRELRGIAQPDMCARSIQFTYRAIHKFSYRLSLRLTIRVVYLCSDILAASSRLKQMLLHYNKYILARGRISSLSRAIFVPGRAIVVVYARLLPRRAQ